MDLSGTEELEMFGDSLAATIAACRERDLRMVWLKVPATASALIAPAHEAGFVFHHAQREYLMMVLGLRPESHIPDYATHFIGIGGVVIDSSERLLVVVERAYHQEGQAPRYKLPGGAAQSGEDLVETVTREIQEETGIACLFERLVCFRHWHGYRYGKSDIYFVARLRPLESSITVQDDEILECRWMPVQEYLGLDYVSPFNQAIVRAALDSRGLTVQEVGGYSTDRKYELFFPAPDGDDAGSV